jgi:hypothetical protein
VDCLDAIRRARTKGKLYCGAVASAQSAPGLAASFGLSADPACYREIDADMARAIVAGVLHRDLAYGTRLIPLSEAEELAAEFVQRFGHQACRYFTNAEFKHDAGAGLVLVRWNPATTATYDTGVLAVGSTESGCVWVADED